MLEAGCCRKNNPTIVIMKDLMKKNSFFFTAKYKLVHTSTARKTLNTERFPRCSGDIRPSAHEHFLKIGVNALELFHKYLESYETLRK